jgi:hypothetical protein
LPDLAEEQLTERYLERAAIMEIEGGMTRLEATTTCFELISKWCKRVGRTVPKAIVDDVERVKDGSGKSSK